MFYKFIGGSDSVLLEVFEKAVGLGSVRFGLAADFNDPFEFKFVSRSPTRQEFDTWHKEHEPHRSEAELSNAWKVLNSEGSVWNAQIVPRINLLNASYLLCLTQRWDSHLMWAHYTTAHHGFAIRYKPEIIDALRLLKHWAAHGDVIYSEKLPELRWCTAPPNELSVPILFTKSVEWKYEREFRVVLINENAGSAIFETIETSLIDGVVLGNRASEELYNKALELKAIRPELKLEQVTSKAGSNKIISLPIEPDARIMRGML